MDATALLVRVLSADPSISVPVFGESIPANQAAPLVLVRTVMRRPATRPMTTWWTHINTIDVQAENPADSHDLSLAVEAVIPTLAGTHLEGVVSDATVDDTTLITDGSWTPTRYRNVVAVSLTARD